MEKGRDDKKGVKKQIISSGIAKEEKWGISLESSS